MSDPIVILTEEPLGADDRVNIERLVNGGDTPLVVVVPANTERHLLVDFLENLSMLEIAKQMKISETAAKVRIHRARKKLKELVYPEGEDR